MLAETKEILPKIYKYCAYQERCTADIKQRLITWEVPKVDFQAVLTHLREEEFLDDHRYARAFVRGKFSIKRWGRNKIRFELRKKGIPTSLIESSLLSEIDEEDYKQSILHLIDKKSDLLGKIAEDEKKQKIIRYLQQKGFEWEWIKIALDEWKET